MASAVAIANPVSAGSLIVESTPAASSLPASSEVPASSTTEFCETLTASSETSPAQLLSKSKTTPIHFAILATVKSAADLDSSRTDNHDDSTALATPTPRPIAARAIDNYFSHLPGETQADATLSPAANTTADNEDVTDRIYEELDTDVDVQLDSITNRKLQLKSGGGGTPIERFLAGIRSWSVKLRRLIHDHKPQGTLLSGMKGETPPGRHCDVGKLS